MRKRKAAVRNNSNLTARKQVGRLLCALAALFHRLLPFHRPWHSPVPPPPCITLSLARARRGCRWPTRSRATRPRRNSPFCCSTPTTSASTTARGRTGSAPTAPASSPSCQAWQVTNGAPPKYAPTPSARYCRWRRSPTAPFAAWRFTRRCARTWPPARTCAGSARPSRPSPTAPTVPPPAPPTGAPTGLRGSTTAASPIRRSRALSAISIWRSTS